MNNLTTPKGTALPLLKLKGKDYLQVAYRLVWFNEEVKNFTMETTFLSHTDTSATCHAKIQILNDNGAVVKSATATKSENAKGFADFAEKAETGSIGRALALLGFGTQHALADLDEGDRIVDSPVEMSSPSVAKSAIAEKPVAAAVTAPVQAKPTSSFRKPAPKATTAPVAATESEPEGEWK